MRALVQRVASASVEVDGERIAAIGPGMLVLVGVAADDGAAEAERLAAKLLKLRIFEDAEGRTNEALGEREILCVSQFTLLADVSRGNRPSFTAAAPPERAEGLYERVCDLLGAQRGAFGARMAVALVNDGPFTLLVEAAPEA
jgi:D-tyrosyl-tRNA(Tyr) deacylase